MQILKHLQEVDDRLGGLRAKVASLSLRVEDHKKHVADLEAELEEKNEQLRTDEKDSAMKELELKTIQVRIDKLKTQLNLLKDNKQYAAMMHEISGREAERSRTEDQTLMLMDNAESARADMEEIRKEIERGKETVRIEEAAVAEEVRGLTGQIREFTAERRGFCGQLEGTVTEKYDRIFRGKGGKAVVPVKGGVCQGCFMGVTKQTIARLWAKKEVMYCPNCARLMYLEGEVQ